MFINCVKPSLVKTQLAPPRPTNRANFSTGNTRSDEIEAFTQNDRIVSYKELKGKLKELKVTFLVTM